jgi:integrase
MASVRKQPSGSYQGIAVHRAGRRQTRVFPRRRQALAWAEELEATWRRDGSFDPRAGDKPCSEWIEVWLAARRVDPVTADKDASQLRRHVRPKWDSWPLASVRKLDVAAWAKDMEREGVGAHTIQAVLALFSSIMRAAVEEGLLTTNPCTRVPAPRPPVKPPFFWTRPESALILAELEEPWRTACDLDMHVGLRLGELLGLRVDAVDWARAQIHVVGVMTRKGWRRYPKSACSQRTVPIPDHVLDRLAPLVIGRPGETFVFPGRGGKPMGDSNFRHRIWAPALELAGRCSAHRRVPGDVEGCEFCVPVPAGVPHDMRHTSASWLAMDGVDLHRIQRLLGHESLRTTQRYAHLSPDAHDRIRESWRRTQDRPVDFQRRFSADDRQREDVDRWPSP